MFKRLKAFSRDEGGNATVEFAVLAFFYVGVIFSGVEGGWLMTRHMMVERGVDTAMRAVRLGLVEDTSYEAFRDRICNEIGVVADCTNNLIVSTQVIGIGAAQAVDQSRVPCVDRSQANGGLGEFNPADGHSTGLSSEIVVVRVCAIVDPLIPLFGLSTYLPLDASNGFPIRTRTAFLNEPF